MRPFVFGWDFWLKKTIRFLIQFIIFETHSKQLQVMWNKVTIKTTVWNIRLKDHKLDSIYSQVLVNRIVPWSRKIKHILILHINISGMVSSVWLCKPCLKPKFRMSWTVFQVKIVSDFAEFCRLKFFDIRTISIIRICIIFEVNSYSRLERRCL